MRRAISVAVMVALIAAVWPKPREAHAVKEFMDQFKARYVDYESNDPARIRFAKRFEQTRCAVCHVKGEEKTVRTNYGRLLDKYLSKEQHKKDKAQILKVLRYVETQPSDPRDPRSATFGERIKQGKLP